MCQPLAEGLQELARKLLRSSLTHLWPQLCSKSFVKLDMTAAEGEGKVGEIRLWPDYVGGALVFVARDPHAMLNRTCAEDDGWLLAYVTHEVTLETECRVRTAPHPTCASPVRKQDFLPLAIESLGTEVSLTRQLYPLGTAHVCDSQTLVIGMRRKMVEGYWGQCFHRTLSVMCTVWACSDFAMTTGAVSLQVYDAMTFSPEPLACVHMPQRVPQGLHGAFVTRTELSKQRNWEERHAEALV
jgi:hypothetical protein